MTWLCARMIEEPEANTAIYNWFVMLGEPHGTKWYASSGIGEAPTGTFQPYTLTLPVGVANPLNLPNWDGFLPIFDAANEMLAGYTYTSTSSVYREDVEYYNASSGKAYSPAKSTLKEPFRIWDASISDITARHKNGAMLVVELRNSSNKRLRLVWNNRYYKTDATHTIANPANNHVYRMSGGGEILPAIPAYTVKNILGDTITPASTYTMTGINRLLWFIET